MKLCVYTVGLPEYNIEESAALLKELGYTGVEWRVDRFGNMRQYFPKDIDEYAVRYWLDNKSTLNIDNIMEECLRAKKACDENGLEIVNLATSVGYDAETLEKVLAAAAAIGCKSIRGPMGQFNAAKPYAEQFEEQRALMRSVEPLLKKYGVKMLIETHHGMMIASASSGRRMLEGFDPNCFGLIFDPGNMVYEGFEDYRKSFEMLGDYLAHVHIKNARLVADGEDEFGSAKWKQDWCPLNKGMANLKKVLEALVAVGYDGALSVEDFSNEMPTMPVGIWILLAVSVLLIIMVFWLASRRGVFTRRS